MVTVPMFALFALTCRPAPFATVCNDHGISIGRPTKTVTMELLNMMMFIIIYFLNVNENIIINIY